ncbi:SusC/RagA family TonB-linked outer membrane protein [Maribacter sp. 2308TA10-17]|uniref:SusC/RagA family TonB-linked outer membrane protein n=1 Tax=Maribacter sp. 2308TA10-17 TaxID=3386276 RepID=UPI0039BCB355
MDQNHDYNSLKPKRKISSFGIGLLSMMICLGAQLAMANPEANSTEVEFESVQSTITGTVTDADGSPLPGANVLVKGTTNGTQTDFDGNFTINADSDATLVFSYIGFASQEVAVGGQSTINVSLAEDASQLEEVVVLGYATQTRGDVTGSVSSVDISEAVKAPIVNAAEALQGRVTGVTVINNGNPGAAPKINIRGFGTANNTNPLFIIDGVQTDNASVLNSINPNDIDQMNVLKDGAAAIYGARAANGVVIITTKGGGYNMNEAEISVDVYSGFSQAANLPGLLNAQQHGDMLFQSAANDGVTDYSHPQYGSGASAVVPSVLNGSTYVTSYDPELVSSPIVVPVTPGGTDWLDAIFRTAPTQNASVSVSNGNESGKYFFSANYLNRDGIQLETGFKQAVVRANTEFKIGKHVTIGEHMSASFSDTRNGNFVEDALRMSPLVPVRDAEGRFAGSFNTLGTANTRNPVAQLVRGKDNFNKLFRVFGDVYLSAKLFDGFTVKTTLAGNIEAYNGRVFNALDPEHGEPLTTNTLTERNNNGFNWTWTNTMNYAKQFGDHSINAIAGVESLSERNKGLSISRTGYRFETPDFYLLDNGSGTPLVNRGNTYDGANSLYSIFGTVSYNYQGKYFVTGTLRNDTSSRFSGDNKSQTFPAISAGWLVSKENFFPEDGIVNRLKLKGSWGQLGNQTLPVSNPDLNISESDENLTNYPINGTEVAEGAFLLAFGNPDLRWETSESTNVGVELGLLDSKLTLEVEYFNIKTIDLITQNTGGVTTTAIDANPDYVNQGDIVNRGFDIAVGYADETASGFSYGISANLSRYKNEVLSLSGQLSSSPGLRNNDIVTRTDVGRPISSFYGLEVVGFDENGRFAYADADGDGTVDFEADRDYIGSPHPDFTYGINLNFGYKGFDLSAFFNGSQGNEIYNYNKIYTDFPTFVNSNRSTRVLDSWTPTNTDATLPALSLGGTGETRPSTYFVEDGSFLRLKNLQLGYSLPSKITEKIGANSVRVYLQGTNLLTFTEYTGFDPEINARGNDQINLGIDSNVYPQAKILTFGINLKL